ncbi:N-acetyltransferase [Segetibacter sp. 3557_3]|uniref:GNAT family N-acetyltransferase n=1 Tax=Segetibacter sp. 3557_3 TaxID=2547429 RepID=UPI001058A4DA|nr:GNAT family N-acetyltransferase [Segetibacter sp. 3557_3]TDH28634.1 N-acetyltransferase [Segetibacter sp. 3557_3]
MFQLKRTDSTDPDFIALIKRLDAELAERDGSDHAFYATFNKVDQIKHVVVAYEGGLPIGCGAMKAFSGEAMEVKRMYTLPHLRGKGVAKLVLTALEQWAKVLQYQRCVLETGKRRPEAIRLYEKSGYTIIDNYGQYAGMENSVCFQKQIT